MPTGAERTINAGDTLDALLEYGLSHVVSEVVRATNSSGVVTFAKAGMSAALYRLSGSAIQTSGDDLFAAFVVQVTKDLHDPAATVVYSPAKYLLGIYHPALGLRIQPSAPQTTCVETFTACWAPGNIVFQQNGATQVLARATLRAERATLEDGTVLYDVGASKYKDLVYSIGLGTYIDAGSRSGEWTTDASGILRWYNVRDGGLSGLAFPAWPGNTWGTNLSGTKTWDRGLHPSEYATRVLGHYLGYQFQVQPATSKTVNVVGSGMSFSGTANAIVAYELYGVSGYTNLVADGAVVLDGAGSGSVSGIPPGKYAVWQFKAIDAGPNYTVDHNEVSPRQWVTVGYGETANVTLDAFEAPTGGDDAICYAYGYGAEPAPGETVEAYDSVLGWISLGTTDSSGRWYGTIPDDTGDPMHKAEPLRIASTTYGQQQWPGPFTLGYRTWQFCIGGYANHPMFGETCLAVTPPGAPWTEWWDGTEGDENLPAPVPSLKVVERNAATDYVAYFHTDELGNVYSDYLPRSPANSTTQYTWSLQKLDGTEVDNLGTLPEEMVYDGGNAGLNAYDRCCTGVAVYGDPIGSKLAGEVTHQGVSDAQIGDGVGENALYEAGRMGLERGGWHPLVEMRGGVDYGTNRFVGGAFLGAVCPFCYGPTWRFPTRDASTVHGYCQNCGTQLGWPTDATDARTFYRGPTIAPGSATTVATQGAPGNVRFYRRELDNWYRPTMREDASHITQAGRGMTTNAQRWFTADNAPPAPEYHWRVGSYSGGVFSQGATASLIETKYSLATTYFRPKATAWSGTTHNGSTTYRGTFLRPDGTSELLSFTVPDGYEGRGAGNVFEDVRFLDDALVIEAERGGPGTASLYTACTNLSVVAGPTTNNVWIIADAPLYVTGAPVLHDQSQTLEALVWDVPSSRRNPDLCQRYVGQGQQHLAWRDQHGRICYQRTRQAGYEWAASVAVSEQTRDFPAIAKDREGSTWCAVVKPTTAGSHVIVYRSRDDGRTWASRARSFVGQYPDLWHGIQGLQYLSVYSGGQHIIRRGYRGLSTVAGSAAIGSVDAARMALVKKTHGELLVAAPSGSVVKLWSSRDDGRTFTQQARTFGGTQADLGMGRNNIEHIALLSGTRAKFFRGASNFSTLLTWPSTLAAGGTSAQTSGIIATSVDSERPASLRCVDRGGHLLAAVTKDATVEVYASRKGGLAWSRLS